MEMVLAWLVLGAAGFGLTKRGERFYAGLTSATASGAGYAWGSTAKRSPGARSQKQTAETAPKKAAGKRAGSTAKPRPTSLREAARTGWASGVQHAHDKQAAGTDFVGRARRATHWTADRAGRVRGGVDNLTGRIGAVRARREAKAAQRKEQADHLAAAKASLTTETQDPPAGRDTDGLGRPLTESGQRFFALRDSGYTGPIDQAGNAVTDDRLPFKTNPYLTEKGSTMTVQQTELSNLTEAEAEATALRDHVSALQDETAVAKTTAASFAERWGDTPWGTPAMNDAAGDISEGVSSKDWEESVIEGCNAFLNASQRARAVGEAASEVGAQGDVRHYVEA